MWSFEGDYRRKPQQRLGGASRTRNIERLELLSQLKNDREERERQRRREAAVLTIQSWTRGMLSQKRTKRDLRLQCDSELALAKVQGITEASAIRLIALLIRIFNAKEDCGRLLLVCQLVVREQRHLSEWVYGSLPRWMYLLPRLANMALQVVTYSTNGENTVSHASPLRLLEIIMAPDSWASQLSNANQQLFLCALYTHLINRGYYQQMVQLIVSRIPEVYESSENPPTPLAESLLHLLMKPLTFASAVNDSTLLTSVIHELCQDVFGGAAHSQICNFVIPCLAANVSYKLPMDRIVAVLGSRSLKFLNSCPAPPLLYSLLMLVHSSAEFNNATSLCNYLQAISELLGGATSYLIGDVSDVDSDDEDDNSMDSSKPIDPVLRKLAEECVSVVNSTEHVGWLLSHVERQVSPEVLLHFSRLMHHLLTVPSLQFHECRLLYSVVARRQLLRAMWVVLSSLQQGAPLPGSMNTMSAAFGVRGPPLLQVLARGSPLAPYERDTLVPLLATFCATLTAVLSTLHDSEFLGDHDENGGHRNPKAYQNQFPFSVEELVKMSASLRDVCVGLVELAHPDTRMSALTDTSYKTMWAHCFKVCVGVLRQIHLRDTRRMFCPTGHWLSSRVSLPLGNCQTISFVPRTSRRQRRLFMPQRWLTRDELETEGPPLSTTEQRRATILQELPFVIPFESRTQVFSTLVASNRSMSQMRADFNEGPMISVSIRRTHIYEDAFDKLSPSNEPNLRLRMRVRLMNAVGLDEVGIDGGGIFREFLSELLKTAFDPTRGFFLLTRENTLYPNPGAHHIAEDYQTHYYFIGRMLGKALYENLLVEVPLAGFFVSKLLGRSSSSVEFHHLDSLDPELCRNLLYLKTYQGDVLDLGLDFTVLNSDLGQNTIEELVPNGANVAVTNENRIEYIYRMADYKLNKQIAKQSQAFKKGVADVVPLEWLQMFDWRELQMLISGASVPIDLLDLMDNTKYGGTYNTDHPTIQAFWQVIRGFDETQKRQLLKFVTSCSRPPLLGFKELQPAFCIQPSGSEDRLPTASTCMNLLKLPEYKKEHTLRDKLLYAITSGSGFELS
ncbi:ubiquitin-protein ligase E3C-like isoform X2 [Homarus americanus]|uniref:ubiquitin-protein ligase E3C-like isoform X2 n=1 Tax=Homarus americanus TaxID=6706 RepID=UPI001C4529E2|nr:ubiquitin-protein ligase E3C-like isoform X2 [Homarus americanus]